MDFSFNPTMHVIVPAAIALVAMAVVLVLACRRLMRVCRKVTADTEAPLPAVEDLPDVSVVVYASDDAEYLSALLPALLAQDYPAPFEVIVVNEGQADAATEVVSLLAREHSNLYLTFTPDGARNLSRKKLALTIGVKAARHSVVVTVDADTAIPSDKWLMRMAGDFASRRCEVVIGADKPYLDEDDMPWRHFRAFDSCVDTVTYIDAALCGRPYRGTSHNLAYRRELFFANKGFSRSLNLRNGEDDVFVSEIATADNTCVQLATDAITTALSVNPKRSYSENKRRRIFTGAFISKRSRRVTGLCSVLLWIWLAAAVYVGISGLPSLLPACFALVTALGLWTPLVLMWRKTMSVLGYGKAGWALPLMILLRPLHTFVARLRASRGKVHNYTWG